jgi:surface antigen
MRFPVRSLLNRNLLALMAFSAALATEAVKAEEALCPLENATLHGTYVLYGTGTRVGVGPIAAVGEFTSDGKGNTKATYTASVNGTIHEGVTVTGVYTVSADCTGTLAESDGSHYHLVVAPNGRNVSWIRTDPGFATSGTVVRLGHLDD